MDMRPAIPSTFAIVRLSAGQIVSALSLHRERRCGDHEPGGLMTLSGCVLHPSLHSFGRLAVRQGSLGIAPLHAERHGAQGLVDGQRASAWTTYGTRHSALLAV